MRNAFYLAAAAFLFAAVPTSDVAAKPGKAKKGHKFRNGSVAKLHGKKSKKKKKKKGKKGSHDGGDSDGSNDNNNGGDTCELPADVSAIVKGVGRRFAFDFGGKIWIRDGEPNGDFFLSFNPSVPGEVFNLTCHYTEFSNVEITAARSSFRISGRCRRVAIDGRVTAFNATNDVQIDNLETDVIQITRVGDVGLQVPAGPLSFGTFAMNEGPSDAS